MIVVEGPDGGGKSTLIKILLKRLHADGPWSVGVVHSPGPLEQGLYEWAVKAMRIASPLTIFDRFPYFSEAVYGPVLRGHALMTPQQFVELSRWLEAKDPLVIYCRPPRAIIRERVHDLPQMGGVKEHLEEIITGYDRQYVHWAGHLRIIQYDWTRPDEGERLEIMLKTYCSLPGVRGEFV